MVTKKSRREQAEVSQVTARERRHARREMKEILTTMRLNEERFKNCSNDGDGKCREMTESHYLDWYELGRDVQ